MQENKRRGRPVLPEHEAKTEFIRERVTPAQKIAYDQKGGKTWLLAALARKPRAKKEAK